MSSWGLFLNQPTTSRAQYIAGSDSGAPYQQALNPTMDDWRKRLSWMSRRLDAIKAKSPPAQLPASATLENQVSTTLRQRANCQTCLQCCSQHVNHPPLYI